jgi:hypothetical protein
MIRVNITSKDVIHSWAVPSLGIKVDAIPGRINSASLFLNTKGNFFGQCSEICGVNHGFMPICVKGVSRNDFYQNFFIEDSTKKLLNTVSSSILPERGPVTDKLLALRHCYLSYFDENFSHEFYRPWTSRMKNFILYESFLTNQITDNPSNCYLCFYGKGETYDEITDDFMENVLPIVLRGGKGLKIGYFGGDTAPSSFSLHRYLSIVHALRHAPVAIPPLKFMNSDVEFQIDLSIAKISRKQVFGMIISGSNTKMGVNDVFNVFKDIAPGFLSEHKTDADIKNEIEGVLNI